MTAPLKLTQSTSLCKTSMRRLNHLSQWHDALSCQCTQTDSRCSFTDDEGGGAMHLLKWLAMYDRRG